MEKLRGVLVITACCIIGVLQPLMVSAQAEEQLFRIEMKDGNDFIGTIVSENDSVIVFNANSLGQITIQKVNIKRIEEIQINRMKDGEYWFENPHATRYLFSTSAIGLKKNEGYYQNTWIFFNNVHYGFTDNFSVGAGLIPLFLFGEGATPMWLLPKFSFPIGKENLHMAIGGMFGGVVGGGESYGVGMAYGTLTAGSTDNNFTLGVGFGYGDGEWSDVPLFNFNGMMRLNRTLYFVTENYMLSAGGETVGILSGALRWAPKNFAVDFGLFRPYVVGESMGGGFIGIPWLGVAIPFGR